MRPIVMSGTAFRALTDDQKAAVKRAGAEAGAFGRALESSQDSVILQQMVDAGQITTIAHEGRDALLEMVIPVQDAYAAQLGATGLPASVRAK